MARGAERTSEPALYMVEAVSKAPSVWVLGCGFLGRALAAARHAAGAAVTAVDLRSEQPQGSEPWHQVQGDAAEPALLRRLWADAPPDVVYACMSTRGGSAEAYRHAYGDTVQSLLGVAGDSGALPRVVYCSSVSVYGVADGSDATETSACMAHGERARILLEAEQLVLSAGGTVARLAPIYDRERCELLRRHLNGEPRLPGSGARWLNYIHREDAVRALCLLPASPPGIYNLCGESFRLEEAYAMLHEETGLPIVKEQSPGSCRGISNRRVLCPAMQSVGWKPRRSMRACIRAWMQEQASATVTSFACHPLRDS